MAEKLKIVSINCRGLADKIKRLDVFNYFRKKKIDIVCLQDIHIEQQNVDKISTEWRAEAVFSSFKSNARGVAILFNSTFDFKIIKTEVDRETMEKFIAITNIYGPNRDSPEFYSNIKNRMEQYHDTFHIMCGDFNIVIDPILKIIVNVNNQNSRKKVSSFISSLNLEDIWRSIH